MTEPAAGPLASMDERSPYMVIEAVVRTIADLSPDIPDEDAAWEAFVDWKGPDHREYLSAIRRSRHSIFYHQHQELYEFGIERTRAASPEEFCLRSGRTFLRMFFAENLFPFLQVALARPGDFQPTIVDMLRLYLHRYTGPKFVLSDEVEPDRIVFGLGYSDPDVAAAYFEQYGLDRERCFRNSFYFISGAFEEFLAQVVAGFDLSKCDISISGLRGVMRLPVKESDRFTYETLIRTLVGYVRELSERQRTAAEGERLETDLIIGSDAMRRTWERIRRASRSEEIVLLRGESGTGKSFIARKIHALSARSEKPLVEVGLTSDIGADNMIQSDLFGHERGAFTGAAGQKQGLFSLADGGTIFLDEVGDASRELQARLLRVVETSTFKRLGGTRDISVDVRIIAATNRDLEKMVKEGSFREDLYYRLNVIPIHLPALRERCEDVPALAEFLLARATSPGKADRPPSKRFEPSLCERLAAYPWPGNIRELDHAIKHAAAMAERDVITLSDMPDAVRARLESGDGTPAPVAPSSTERSDVIDVGALRREIRSLLDPQGMPPQAGGSSAHVDHARRTYLATLIEELGGDLSLVARFWDRSSENTIRKLVRTFGLKATLEEARRRSRA